MAATIDDGARQLLDAPNFAHVATLRKDGSVHGVVVWVHTEGDHVVLNTAAGRSWERNIERDPRVTLTVANSENPYHFVSVRGHVVDVTDEGADEHIEELSHKYTGAPYANRVEGERRVKVVVEPDSVKVRGG